MKNELFFSNSNLEDLLRGIRLYNGLIGDDDDQNGLLKAARDLSNAFGNFLGALDPSEGKVCLLFNNCSFFRRNL